MERGYTPSVGDVFNEWTVVDNSVTKIGMKGTRAVVCRCSCGTERAVRIHELVSGGSKGCECVALKKRRGQVVASGNLPLTLFSRFKKSAAIREIEWSVTMDELWSLFERQQGLCALSKVPLILETSLSRIKGEANITASLDRINSDLGYTIDNVQWVHKDVNKMKQELKQEDFITMCKLIAHAN